MFASLYKKTDIAPLAAFRIIFGLLMAGLSCKLVLDGTIYRYYIAPKHTLTFIGFDWLQPLPGRLMYGYNLVMTIAAFGIAVGYKYRLSLASFFVLFTAEYLMQKTWYNNHYYLIMLLCILLFMVPANGYAALDSRQKPGIKTVNVPYWCHLIFILQLTIMYFFAAIAKCYPDWLNGTYPYVLFNNYNFTLPHVLKTPAFYSFIALGGFLFDLLIVPLLLYKKTRFLATLASLAFHLFNSFTLGSEIGFFPYLSLGMLVFFYPPETIRKLFFPTKAVLSDAHSAAGSHNNKGVVRYLLVPFFIIQLALPLRHLLISGNVLWTEEGHRLSWRMMQKAKSGTTQFRVVDRHTNKELPYNLKNILLSNQIRNLGGKPDMIWQAAQLIRKDCAAHGKEVAVYVTAKASLNGHAERLFINPATDLAHTTYNYFGHDSWVLLYD